MDIDELVNKIIPPPYREYRQEFNNIPIIDALTAPVRKLVEDKLIDKLKENRCDMLIYETLAYMQVTRSVPELYACFEYCHESNRRLILACSIYELTKDGELVDIVIDNFKRIDSLPGRKYGLPVFFYYLGKVKHKRIIDLVEQYVHDTEYLISYNAKKALEHLEDEE